MRLIGTGILAFIGIQYLIGVAVVLIFESHLLPEPIARFLSIPLVVYFLQFTAFIGVIYWVSKQRSKENLKRLKNDVKTITKKS